MKNGTRAKVLDAFRANPYQTVTEMGEALGLSAATISGHLCALERAGEIERQRLIHDTSRQASTPSDRSQMWVSVSKKGAVERREGALRPRRARGEDALQARINEVVKNAEEHGTCFRADYIRLDRLSGCKCG
jgi:DNA-binding MarR family transcriptional regulator